MKRLSGYLVAVTFCLSITPLRAAERPNFVLIMVDDLGWRDLGYTGNEVIQTPNMDALARSGAVFTRAYAAAPNCAPTRACLMTGQYPPRHGVYTVVDERHAPGSPQHKIIAATSQAELATEHFTLAEALRRHGYATGMVGMWNLGRGRRGPRTPTGQGFDSYIQPKDLGFERDAYFNHKGEYLTDRLTDAGLAFINAQRGKPFCLYLAYHAVHSPFEPKPDLLKKYKGKCDDPAYAATVEALDQSVGRVVKALDAAGVSEKTYIIFTSDNGGTRRYVAPLRGGKGTLYEGGLRVPAFICGPGIAPKCGYPDPISTIDFYPTLLELAGLPKPERQRLDGVSLAPLVLGKAKRLAPRRLFWHFPCYVGPGKPSSALLSGKYKLIEFFETGSVQLYDLSVDEGESRDLSMDQPQRADKLHQELRKMQKAMNAPRPMQANPNYDPGKVAKKDRGQRGKGKNEGLRRETR